MNAPRPQSRTGLLIIVAVGVVVLGGCLLSAAALLGVPLPFSPSHRPTMSEVKMNLKAAYLAERSFFDEKDRYSDSPSEIGFAPESNNRYAYFFGDGGVVDVDRVKYPSAPSLSAMRAALPAELIAELGVTGACPASCAVTVAAVGNLDGDATLDVWSIGTTERYFAADVALPGVPYNHVNDVEK